MVDAGDQLFPDDTPLQDEREQRLLKADLIASAMSDMGVTAVGVGDQDLLYGVGYVQELSKKHNLPFLCANIVSSKTGAPAFSAGKVATIGPFKVGLFGITGTAGLNEEPIHLGPDWKIADPIATAKAQVQKLKGAGATYIVLLSHLGLEKDKVLAEKVPGIHLILGSHTGARLETPEHVGATAIVAAGDKGKYLGQLTFKLPKKDSASLAKAIDATSAQLAADSLRDLEEFRDAMNAQAETAQGAAKEQALERARYFEAQIASEKAKIVNMDGPHFVHELLPLSREVGDDPKIAKMVKKTLETIATTPARKTGPKASAAPLSGPYVGAGRCAECHEDQYKEWRGTGHAHAYQTLVKETRQFDYDCVSCHSTAWKKPGGFSNPWQVGELTDVQCEMCHGPGREHSDKPKERHLTVKFSEGLCRTCHSIEQTGDRFKFSDYIVKVSHGKPPKFSLPPAKK